MNFHLICCEELFWKGVKNWQIVWNENVCIALSWEVSSTTLHRLKDPLHSPSKSELEKETTRKEPEQEMFWMLWFRIFVSSNGKVTVVPITAIRSNPSQWHFREFSIRSLLWVTKTEYLFIVKCNINQAISDENKEIYQWKDY